MASTIVVDQNGKQLGRMFGFRNFVTAYMDANGVPWLPVDGKQLHDLTQLITRQTQRIAELEAENLKLRVEMEFNND